VGAGWYLLERQGTELFRWADNDAEVVVTALSVAKQQVRLELEPGPGLDGAPLDLEVLDAEDQVVASTRVVGRDVVTLMLPIAPGRAAVFRVRAARGDASQPGDLRTLNFRVFKLGWDDSPAFHDPPSLLRVNDELDIVPAGARRALESQAQPADGLLVGYGWYPTQTVGADRFRWVNKDAEILVMRPTGAKRELGLDLESGPSAGGQPVTVSVVDEQGQTVVTVPVQGRRALKVRLPITPGSSAVYRLRVDGGSVPILNDSRHLNLRVHRVDWADSPTFFDAATLARTNASPDVGPVADARELEAGRVPADGLFVGYGWYSLESVGGERFRWLENDGEILVVRPTGARRELGLDLESGPSSDGRPVTVSVLDEQDQVLLAVAVQGRRALKVPLTVSPGAPAVYRLRVDGGGVPSSNDSRRLNLRLYRLDWADSPTFYDATTLARTNANPDVGPLTDTRELQAGRVPADGLFVGAGWYPLETVGETRFRWVDNDAEILVVRPTGTRRNLGLDLESGPGAGGQPVTVSVLNEQGQVLLAVPVQGPRTLKVPLPLTPSTSAVYYRLRVDGGGLPTSDDSRRLNLRVYKVDWADNPTFHDAATLARTTANPDVGPLADTRELQAGRVPADGLFVGAGWYPLETVGETPFRWVNNDAEILVVRPTGTRQQLALVIEPGPGVGSQPFLLSVLDESGKPVASVFVPDRRPVTVTLPVAAGPTAVYRLHVDSGGAPTQNDGRVLNFRVFRFEWAGP
jgi:hypothetical protein